MTQEIWYKQQSRQIVFICMMLITITFAVYWQVGSHQFLNFDDDLYITKNANVSKGLTGSTIVWALTSIEECNWFPLTRLSHALDVQLYGMNPRGHHFTNVAIHSITTVLLFIFLFQLTAGLWKSAFVAALFALHPLHIESVAWAAERKDVLSACLGLITLLAYAQYVKADRDRLHSAKRLYLLTLFSFMLGLMAKPMLVTLPVLLLLLDYWPLNRLDTSRHKRTVSSLLQEKLPFFACSLLSSAMTIYVQRKGGAVVTLEWIPFNLRLENSLVSYVKYITKTVWPHDLAILYPFAVPIPLWQTVFSTLFILFVSGASLRYGRRYPYLPVGWFWYIVTLLPVIGLIQVGNQAMADRYAYIPSIGLYIIIAWGVTELFSSRYIFGIQPAGKKPREYSLVFLAVLVLVATGAVTWHQLGYWKNNFTIYRHTLNVTGSNYIIHYNLGLALGKSGNINAALQEFQTAVSINPKEPDLRNMLASTLADTGNVDAAITEFQKVLAANPDNRQARSSLEFWSNWKEKLKTVQP